MVGNVLAQAKKAAAEDTGERSYGIAYTVVVLLVVLGLIVIGRPGSRTREIKQLVYEDDEEE